MNTNFSIADEIQKLKSLLDAGAIRLDEFEDQKKQLKPVEFGGFCF